MGESAHVLVFPYPAQGHMIPLVDITRHLATRGLTITILVTPKNLPLLNPLLSAHPQSITTLVLPFPAHPDIPSGVENTIDLPADAFSPMMRALSELRNPIIDWFRNHPSPPVAIISDFFLGWTHHLASHLSIRRFAFFPTGAFTVSFYDFLWHEMPKHPLGGDEEMMVGSPEIPGSPVYPWWQLSPVFRSCVEGDPNSEFIRDSMIANWESHGFLLNTFDGLEWIYLDYLINKSGRRRIWSVGPVLPPDDVRASERGGSTARTICSWLDTCQDHTVVYACFGSQVVLTNNQMKELTLGLAKSGVKFILSVKGATKGHDEGDNGSIPEGLIEDRGLVIKGWVPQVVILKHKAICAFLTHCGCNSMLESIVAGVPMLAWPMSADQFLNATLIVDQLNIGIKVCQGAQTVPDSNELAKLLGETKSDKWSEMRNRILALAKVALDAISSGGSSFNNLDDITRCISENCYT